MAQKETWVAFVGAVAAILTACNGSSIGSGPAAITVNTRADCQGGSIVGHPLNPFPLRIESNGRRYRMVRCQAVDVLLVHAGPVACSWSPIQTNDSSVM